MLLDLNKAFPMAEDGTRGPLPKQKEFLDAALHEGSPKYIRYLGGIGSGKTLIGCIVMLSWALKYGGDWGVFRQFFPELRDTTMKNFLEIVKDVCPQLLIEHRVADAIVKLRSQNGVATIMFRGLEEPDKLRSLNLNGFYIDEAAQVSEAAFILLQGRLRGKHLRKGIITQNSGGLDWTYRWFVKKDHIKSEEIKAQFLNIKAPSTENIHLPTEYVATILETWSDDKIQREIYADETAFAGQVYSDFRHDIHVIQPFKIPENWTRVAGADHGYRNPSAWVWAAIDPEGTIFVYREFYQKEWIIEEICKGKPLPGGRKQPGVVELGTDPISGQLENLDYIKMDPSTRSVRGQSRRSDWDVYMDNLPQQWSLTPANNEKTAGIDRIKTLLKVNTRTKKPMVFFFNTCTNLIEEMVKYRYDELSASRAGKANEKEDPRKVDDHALDAFRYLCMGQPEPHKPELDMYERVKYNSLEGVMMRDLQILKKGKDPDPFSGM